MAKQDDYSRYTIRVPAELYERLQVAAGDRSLNAEIIERLQKSFDNRSSMIDMVAQETVKQIAAADKALPRRVRENFLTAYEEARNEELSAIKKVRRAASDVYAELEHITGPSDADM